jgi:hypothetical protein
MLLGERGGTLAARYAYRQGRPVLPLPFNAFDFDAFARPYQAAELPQQPLNPGGMTRPPTTALVLEQNVRNPGGLPDRYSFRINRLRGVGAGTDGGITQLYVNDQWVDIATFLDQPLVLTTTGTVYELPDINAAILATVAAGQPLGTIYSYVQNAQGFWWQVTRDGGVYAYVLFSATQTVTPPQPAPPGSNPFGLPDFSKLFAQLGTAGKWLIGGGIAIAALGVLRKL